MKIVWDISASDVRRLKEFVESRSETAFVRGRRKRNLGRNKPYLTKEIIWIKMLGCLLTSQQRSGPGSPIDRFLRQQPFPVTYQICLRSQNPGALCTKALKDSGGIRFVNDIGERAEVNLKRLECDLWPELLKRFEQLRRGSTRDSERVVADFIDDNLKGFGPKQSRNFLQWLSLTRYEIPVDSRVMKWLNEFGFPLQLNSSVLSDRGAYHLILDGIQALCAKAKIYPCILDAAIFASFDDEDTAIDVDAFRRIFLP